MPKFEWISFQSLIPLHQPQARIKAVKICLHIDKQMDIISETGTTNV